MLLGSTRSKCFTVVAPHNQVIRIEYDAPDLELSDGSMTEATRKAQEVRAGQVETKEGGTREEDGMDTQWNKRMRERLERIRSKKLRDTSITVSQKGLDLLSITNSNQTTSYDEAGTLVTSGTGRVREELAQKQGRIEFLTGRDSGTVDICVQSVLATIKKPARFHLQVDMAASDNEYDDDDRYLDDDDSVKQKKEKDPDHLEHKELTTKMSRLERDLQTLHNRVKACVNNADYNKDQEALFHEQSISMNRASRYWPIIQLTVLLVTGFTQANHIVRYLKSHHIGM